MDRWFLIAATLFAAVGGGWGMIAVHRGSRSQQTVWWMAATLISQFIFLSLRGQERGSCPLHDPGEIMAYLAWAVTLFYLLVGPAYRLSLLGVFSAPLVVAMQVAALILVESSPNAIHEQSLYHALHSSAAVLAYGALGLAAISGVMFLVVNHQLKEQQLQSSLFRNMPPVRLLLVSLERLLWLGTGLLTVGVIAGFLMPQIDGTQQHFLTAMGVWLAYLGLLGFKTLVGMTGRKLALAAVGIFGFSLLVLFFV